MNESYEVLHMESRVSIASGLNRHITRQYLVSDGERTVVSTWTPANADPAKSEGNIELVSRIVENEKGKSLELTLQQAVDRRIRQAGIKPRKGQATCIEIIFSGSHDTMIAMDRNKLLRWAKETVKWAQDTWGKENVVSAVLHVDEQTPHIHLIIVPIVTGQSRRTMFHQKFGGSKRTYNIDHNKLRLCKNEVYTDERLYHYHDSYADVVTKKYGLNRGLRALPGSKAKHMDSEEYNRVLQKQAIETKALIDQLKADYDEKKAEYEVDIQQQEAQKNSLSSAVIEEQKKYNAAEAKTKEAEKEAKKAEEHLSELEGKIEKNISIINNQVSDFNNRKEELKQTKVGIDNNNAIIKVQEQTIADNAAVIKKQEKIKSSTVISDDAAEEKILEKLQTAAGLEKEITELRRAVLDEKSRLEIESANLKRVYDQLSAKFNLTDIPQKGLLGLYRTEDVDNFIKSVSVASLLQSMNSAPGYVDVSKGIKEENDRLRKVEDDYEDFKNSPERMRQQLDYLEKESTRHKIISVLQYVIQEPVNIISFEVDESTKEILAKFTNELSATEYIAHIMPGGSVYYTDEPINSFQEARARGDEDIWCGGILDEIRAEREKEDTMKRYSTKLSLLTNEKIKIKNFVSNGKDYLFFATNGSKYLVQASGKTYSTKDARVKDVSDVYQVKVVWTEHGDINTHKKNRGMRR